MRSKNTTIGAVIAGLGVLCLIAAAIFVWVVTPSRAQVPADTNTTRDYEGTAKFLLNPQALAVGDKANAVTVNAPATASRTVKVLSTSGDVAKVSDKRTVTVKGQVVGGTDATYAVNRKTLAATTDHPSGWNVIPAQGLTVSWPIGSKKQSYTGWVNETQTTTTLTYQKQEKRGGVDTYVYRASVPPTPIKDQQVLAALPSTLPVSAIGVLESTLPLPPALKSQLTALLPSLKQPIPLSYVYSLNATYWIEPSTGIVVDVQQEETRQAGLAMPNGGTSSIRFPVYDVALHGTQASVNAAAQDASNNANKIHTASQTLPLIFLIVGVVALLVGVLLIVLGRRSGAPPATVSPAASGR